MTTKPLAIALNKRLDAEFDGSLVTLLDVDCKSTNIITMTVDELHTLCEFIRENWEHGTCP